MVTSDRGGTWHIRLASIEGANIMKMESYLVITVVIILILMLLVASSACAPVTAWAG